MKKSNLYLEETWIDRSFAESSGLDGHGYTGAGGVVREPRNREHYRNGFHDGENFILAVEKCGLMSTEHQTVYHHRGTWFNGNLNDYPDHQVHMVVRDPVERWIAGMAEHIAEYYYRNDISRIDLHDWADYKMPWYYDKHIISLSTFAHELPSNTIFWKLENLQSLYDYCGLGKGSVINDRAHDKYGDRQLKLQITQVLKEESDFEWVKDFYSSDYQLLELAR